MPFPGDWTEEEDDEEEEEEEEAAASAEEASAKKQPTKQVVKRGEPVKVAGKPRVQKKSDDSEIRADKEENVEWEGENDGDTVASEEVAKDDDNDEDMKDEDEPSKGVTNKNGDNVAPEKKRETQKQLKTLIGDWGDDEEDF